MYQRIVMTTGVSVILTTQNVLSDELRVMVKGEKLSDQDPFDPSAVRALFLEYKRLLKERLAAFRDHRDNLSVELSLLHALKNRDQLAARPRVSLLTSSTNTGYFASLVNQLLLEVLYEAGVTIHLVDDLTADSTANMKETLGRFMDEVYQRLAEGEPRSTCFAAVGGYKVMTTYGSFIGSMMGYSTCYMHEGSKFLHVIPPMPIDLPESFVLNHQDLLKKVYQENTLPVSALDEEEASLISEYPSIFQVEKLDDSEGGHMVSLTLTAEFLLKRGSLRSYLEPAIYLSKNALETFESDGHTKKWVEGELKTMMQKPADSADFFHDKEFKELDRKKVVNHLYKSPDQHQVFRCTWFKEGNDLFIEKIWTDHDEYEREAARGVGMYTRSDRDDFAVCQLQ